MRPLQTQLGFDALLAAFDETNVEQAFARETAHLPSTIDEAMPFMRGLIERHHAAMLVDDFDEVMDLREEARLLASRLNGGKPGILAGNDAPGCVLERETAAPVGAQPLWGQHGEFCVTIGAMEVRVEIDGMFGIGSTSCLGPAFYAHAVDYARPFLSETGYRLFSRRPCRFCSRHAAA
jgi:hypothetical protein